LAPPSRRAPRALRHFRTPTTVYFAEDAAQRHTVLTLITTDRPGLLCRIGHAFMHCGIRVHNARIATIGARAEDIFLITDDAQRPLADPLSQTRLREALERQLDGDPI
ncbi:MAG TPA: [protein-PII] uridylyltransferase, partial [Plasticicumulans sp.]|nr:[protein-PII] uridylyltransferase [Plasticicumulans sp.]